MADQETPEGGALPSGANATPPPANSTPPAKGSDAASPPAASDPGDKPAKPPKSGEQLRIDELTRRLRESERRYDRLFNSYEDATRRKPEPTQQPSQPKTLKDYNYDEAAYTAAKDQEAKTSAAQAAREEAAKIRAEEEAKSRRATFDKRAAKFAETTEDYESVISGDWACSQAMAEVIEESEEGPAVAYYLAQHPEISSQLAQLPATKAARELTRIEDRLVADRKAAAARASQAPPPPPKLEGADPGNVERDPLRMNQKQFNKWREGYLGRRR